MGGVRERVSGERGQARGGTVLVREPPALTVRKHTPDFCYRSGPTSPDR